MTSVTYNSTSETKSNDKMKKADTYTCVKDMIALDIIKSKCSKSVHPALNEGYASFISEMIAVSLTLGILSEVFLSCQNLNCCLCLLTKWNEDESLKYHCSFLAASILYCQCKGGWVCVRNFSVVQALFLKLSKL